MARPRLPSCLLLAAFVARHVSCFTIVDLQKLTAGTLSTQSTSLDFCTDKSTAGLLSGPLPIELGQLTKLTSLQICNQNLSGGIPPQLGNLTALTVLNLTSNRLTGAIPATLGSLTLLKTLALQSNKLTGPIPTALGSLQSLETLQLWNNSLSGQIPPELGALSSLTSLFLQQNSLSGPIPASLGSLTQLRTLVLEYNKLTGPIPPELGALTLTTRLSLAANQLTGTIPRTLQLLANLRVLNLPGNNLTGPIPLELASLTHLQTLNLANNKLSGPIPPSLVNPPNLTALVLVSNNLSGVVPPGFLARFGLSNILPGNSQLSIYGSPDTPVPTPFPLPSAIPPFVPISTVAYAPAPATSPSPAPNPSPNPVAPTATNATNPDPNPSPNPVAPVATNATNPDPNPPSQTPSESPNPPSETPSAAQTPPREIPQTPVKEDTHPRLVVIAVVVTNVALVSLIITSVAVYYYRRKAKRNAAQRSLHAEPDAELGKDNPRPLAAALAVGDSSRSEGSLFSTSDSSPLAFEMSGKEPPAPPPTSARARARFEPDPSSTPSTFFHRTFLLETLRKATGDFSPDNLVGQGASATVYSATLPDGSLVAVKRLNPDEGFDAKAWRAELAALGKARHRNLVPLLGVCSEGGERLLVLELFSGGSLRERLGATRASALALTWEERMNVVEGVCRGLAYLHHDITPPLLHRNVKPANVLLRGSARALEACIADFGLACLLREPEEGGAPYAAAGDNPAGGSKFMSVKRDVYSFGVLVLEVLSGRSVSEAPSLTDSAAAADALVEAASRAVLNDGRGFELLDPAVADAFDALEAERCIGIALECLQQDPDFRPTMESVNLRLKTLRSRRFMRQKSGVAGMSPRYESPRVSGGVNGASPRYGTPPSR